MSSTRWRFHPITTLAIFSMILNVFLVIQDYRRSIVTHVVDGDTLQLADNRRVRLRSIDAPEKGRCQSSEAKKFLEQQVLHRHIRLKDPLIDEYGRIVAIAIVEDFRGWIGYMSKRFDPLLNRSMLSHGFARHFNSGTTNDAVLKKASDGAKSSKRGIYSDDCRSSIPSSQCVIKGNIRSGAKTYYLPTCNAYKQVIVDESYGDRWFVRKNKQMRRGL